jgi:hypothetical protein
MNYSDNQSSADSRRRVRKFRPMTLVAGALLLGGCVAFASCSSDSSDKATPTAGTSTAIATASTAPPSSTASASVSATEGTATSTTPAPSPTPNAAAEKLAETAGYFLYTTRTGDTPETLAQFFNGEPGSAKAGFPQQILDVNGITADIKPGQEIAIPVLASPKDIIPSIGLATALKAKMNPQTILYEPSPTFIASYGGKVALHSLQLGAANASGGGYRMEYWLTDVPAITDGTMNPDAKVTTPLYVISSGELVPPADAKGDVARFEHNGINYAVTKLDGAKTDAIGLIAGMQIVLGRTQ